MRLLVTRPEPDALKLRAALEEHGHEATVEPLLSVSFADADAIDLDGVQALIATSRNALRALKSHPLRGEARKLPLFAVGRATAAEAPRARLRDGRDGSRHGAGARRAHRLGVGALGRPAAASRRRQAGRRSQGRARVAWVPRAVSPSSTACRPPTALSEDTRRAAGHGRDRGRHPDVAANCDNLCHADAQAGPGLGGPRARPFLPVRGDRAASAAAGRRQDRDCRRARGWKKCLP